jgi:hypothetical protein
MKNNLIGQYRVQPLISTELEVANDDLPILVDSGDPEDPPPQKPNITAPLSEMRLALESGGTQPTQGPTLESGDPEDPPPQKPNVTAPILINWAA